MKIDFDCIRDLLFTIEAKTDYNNVVVFTSEDSYGLNKNYSFNEVLYHLRYLDQAGMLYKAKPIMEGMIIIDLTPEGHKFINEIRSDTNWDKTKDVATKAGVFTLEALKDIAVSVASNAIQKHLYP